MKEEKKGKLIRETELLRMYEAPKELGKELDEKASFEINYKGTKIKGIGFNTIKDKEGKLQFAYKFKHEDQTILYYIPKDNKVPKEKILSLFQEARNELNKVMMGFREYELVDMEEYFKSSFEEIKLLEKEKKKK